MAQNGYGNAAVAGHVGRIPNYGRTNVNPMGSVEPPACIQNAMMTKDKKPFTYTPGGLDLSQIRTPSMARRMARQRSLEEQQEQAYAQQQQANGGYRPQGGPIPPPPPPPKMSVPPPPPPPPALVIEAPQSKSPKPVLGERPEIVIPENPIGMLRKTNSPYHWEAEKAELNRIGPVPKFVEKVPSPLTVKMPPSSFSQQPPTNYTPPNSVQRQNYPYANQTPGSPVHRPEAQYPHQKSASPIVTSPPPIRDVLQRQDSQFNKSPQPFAGQSPMGSDSPYSPTPNNHWRQPERRDSPASNANNSPQSPHFNRGPLSPNPQQYSPNHQNQSSPNAGAGFHTLPRTGQRNQEANNVNNHAIYNNLREARPQSPVDDSNATPWRTNTLNRQPRENDNQVNNQNNHQAHSPPWKSNEFKTNQVNNNNNYVPPWVDQNRNQQQTQYTPPWVSAAQDNNNNKVQENNAPWRNQEVQRSAPSPPKRQPQEQPRFQSSMSIPVTPRKQPEQNNAPQREAVYVNQEPVYYCPESPKSIPPWVKTQKEKTKTPPPEWVQRPLEVRKSLPRELMTPPRDANQEPEWVKKSNEMNRGVREVVSPPKYQQTAQPNWSTKPSDNRKSLPRDNGPASPQQGRIIPVQIEDSRDRNNQPQLRITIDMQPHLNYGQGNQAPYSQPTQRIMRVLSPQLVRIDDGQAASPPDLPSLSRTFQNEPKTRIIPIQIEGASGSNKSFGGRY